MLKEFLSLAVFFLLVSSLRAQYYFTAPNGDECPVESCYNLSDFDDFRSNNIYYFLKGNHTISRNSLITFHSLENVTFKGAGKSKEGDHFTIMETEVVVKCLNDSGLLFINSSNITVQNITFIRCGGVLSSSSRSMLLMVMRNTNSSGHPWINSRMALAFIESSNVKLEHISIQHSYDFGLLTVNSYNMTIVHSSFAYNNIENYGMECLRHKNCYGGNALLVYTQPMECSTEPQLYVTDICFSNFSFGFDSNEYSRFAGSGLAIYLEQGDAYGLKHHIDNVMFYGNSGVQGANFRYTVTKSVIEHSLSLTSIQSLFANEKYSMKDLSSSTYGAGLYILVGRSQRRNLVGQDGCFNGTVQPVAYKTTLTIDDCTSSHNSGAYGTGIYLHWDVIAENQYNVMENCVFNNNSGFGGAGILLVQENNLNYRYQMKNITVSHSRKFIVPNIGFISIASAILIRRSRNISFSNLEVSNNPSTGMFLLNSQASFSGNNQFLNNTAVYGGGLQIHGDSCIILEHKVSITFQSNAAHRSGGAIFVQPSPFITIPCFFQPYDTSNEVQMSILFKNNYARLGGSAVYGANIDSCYLTMRSPFFDPANDRRNVSQGTNAFESIFNFEQQNNHSKLSSDPTYVCFCESNDKPQCMERNRTISIHPGETVTFSIVAVGVRHGTTPGIINMEELNINSSKIKSDILSSNVNCTNVIYTAPLYENVNFEVNYFINQVNIANNLSVYAQVQYCPIGFELSHTTEKCDCNKEIMNLGQNVTCDQSNSSFWHKGGIWIGYDNTTQCSGFITSSSCPFDYCVSDQVTFTIEMQHLQCKNRRSGIQCGACPNELSLMLGTNECGECNDNYLALLIVFALAGVALVILIVLLNLTVSFGTINGLIFYANIVKINEANLFPNGLPSQPIPIFISWLNLDFGIPSCFSENLDAVLKTSLQFVFPVYLWTIVILIAVIMHFSSRPTKIMGRRVIPLFATLVLLSFTKLLRICVLVWQFEYYYCDGYRQRVWAFDPNIPYWSLRHTVLVVVTILVFALLIVPYTLLLVFSPLVEKYVFGIRLFKFCTKLKPFIDAYDGPYRDKYRYWTGLLLLARVLLVPIFARDTLNGIKLIVIMCAVLLSIIAFTSGLYRHKALDALEIWFIFQVLFIISLANESNLIAIISVSMAFVTFIGIIIFHVFYQLNWSEKIKLAVIRKWEEQDLEINLSRNLSAYTTELFNGIQKPRSVTSVRINQKAKYVEDGAWVVNKRETLLRDF